MIACGALGAHVREITARRGWQVEVHTLPSLLHNHPERIAPAAERLARELQARGLRVALGYADCGSYGALDGLCERLNLRRLPGLHCYDVFAGPGRLREMFEREPGTYLLTDFLVRSFRRSVLAELGLNHTRNYGRTTSATTGVWSGWRSHATPRSTRRPTPSPKCSGCR